MKGIFILVVVVALAGFVCFNISAITAYINSATAMLHGVDADSLEGKPLKTYALPHSHCKAGFPGEPHAPSAAQQLYNGLQSGETKVMADAKQVYYLAELSIPAAPLAAGGPSGAAGVLSFAASNSGMEQFAKGPSALDTTGNNSTAGFNNDESVPLKIQNALDSMSRSWLTEHGTSAEQTLPLALKGGLFSGREITGRLNDGAGRFKLRFFCNYPCKTIVIIGATGDGARVDSADTKKFIESLDMWQ